MSLITVVLFFLGCVDNKENEGGNDVVTEALDADGDGYTAADDCDDSDPSVSPDSEEICDGIDNNCDDQVDENVTQTFYVDADQDGFGNPEIHIESCQILEGYVGNGSDCDDLDSSAYPSALEVCDGVDNDCNDVVDDGMNQDYFVDIDLDGFGDDNNIVEACDLREGLSSVGGDCDDQDNTVFPTAVEVCDVIDNDCDGSIDEDVTALYYLDMDNDGYGDPQVGIEGCTVPTGYVDNSDDCNDIETAINPDALESCDGFDNDCDGDIDEGASLEAEDWYQDNDNDGYGDSLSVLRACVQPAGYVGNDDDCNDNNDSRYPGAQEYCNSQDDDCDGDIDELGSLGGGTYYSDGDNDGFGDTNQSVNACSPPSGFTTDNTDCDDNDNDIYPAAPEYCDGEDNDCDLSIDEEALNAFNWFADSDGDLYGDINVMLTECSQPSGFVSDSTDCNDNLSSAYPGADELCDGVDNNCDLNTDEDTAIDALSFYLDSDNDGFGDTNFSVISCTIPSGYVSNNSDCNDSELNAFPGNDEFCDGIDNNCDLNIDEDTAIDVVPFYLDSDNDGFGDTNSIVESCNQPIGYVSIDNDCNDGESNAFPGNDEYCDGIDNNCDLNIDEDTAIDVIPHYLDSDNDGFGDPNNSVDSCSLPSGYVSNDSDCNDGESNAFPGNDEYCDGIDNNCDLNIDEDTAIDALSYFLDSDNDGYGDVNISVDSCSQPSGYVSDDTDCDDSTNLSAPNLTEICDTIDNDCNGLIDDGQTSFGNTYYNDADNDGYGDPNLPSQACSQPQGYVLDNTDCDDFDNDSYPNAIEYCDGEDNDCNTFIDDSPQDGYVYFTDGDGDGFGDPTTQMMGCSLPSNTVMQAGDCNDSDMMTYSGANELCDGIDNNCNGTIDDGLSLINFWPDTDGDNWGDESILPTQACAAPPNMTDTDEDCDDNNPNISPVATEDCLDGIDNDCSGDSDCDDWAACKSIEPTCWVCGDGYQDVNEDCDDNNNLNGDGCDSNCISEMDLSGLYGSWSSESRSVYVFKSDSNAPLSNYNTFCADRGLSWFNPLSSSDAQTAITNCYNYDAYHTWIITDAPTGNSTWNGYSVTVDSPSCVNYSSSGLSAIRQWGCSYCDPENHGVTACWDGHVYDWLLCEGP